MKPCAAALALVAGCGATEPANPYAMPPMVAPADNPTTPAKVELGRLLFHDPIFSADRRTACVTCHAQYWGMGDGLPRSIGTGGTGAIGTGRRGAPVARNAPSLWNVGWRESLFRDGRARSLEAQVLGPLGASDELGRDLSAVTLDLAAVPEYARRFAEAFPDDPTPVRGENVQRAIAAFERTLISDRAPWDRFVAGDAGALDAREQRGWSLFRSLDCASCHAPPRFETERFASSPVASDDPGRAGITGFAEDRGRFRVPSLRNARETGPYFHDGRVESLDEAVSLEAAHRARALTRDEREAITAFLSAGLIDRTREPYRPGSVPSGLPVPDDGFRAPR